MTEENSEKNEEFEEIRENMENLEIEDQSQNQSQNQNENESQNQKNKIDIELKEFSVISEKFEYEGSFSMPTPESLSKLFDTNVIKDLVSYDIKKYKSFLTEGEDGEIHLNLNSINSIQNISILKLIFLYFGGINSENDIYTFYENATDSSPKENDAFIDDVPNYIEYIFQNTNYLTYKLQFEDIENLFNSLKELGITIPIDDKNIVYRNIKDSVMSNPENKILVLITPSNNFWVKSERNVINEINYDLKLNNYTKLFYNANFIRKFLKKIANHRRCKFGFLSSMTYKNLKIARDGLITQFKDLLPNSYSLIDQKAHDNIYEGKKEKPKFFRNLSKIIGYIKTVDKYDYFNETNILILESEPDKMIDSTKNNSIIVNVFSEQYLEYDEKKKAIVDIESDKIIDYIVKLLENCPHDVREYISKNRINPQKGI